MKSADSVIVVLDNGFVFYGDLQVVDDTCTLHNASNIRKYGTTRGLGQLAIEGPTKQTVLDKVTSLTFEKARVVFVMESCKWRL
jgi:small nuclear ribonucleoprotein (snRNP)-like protein